MTTTITINNAKCTQVRKDCDIQYISCADIGNKTIVLVFDDLLPVWIDCLDAEGYTYTIDQPAPQCETDADCPTGYKCIDGNCYPEQPQPPDPADIYINTKEQAMQLYTSTQGTLIFDNLLAGHLAGYLAIINQFPKPND